VYDSQPRVLPLKIRQSTLFVRDDRRAFVDVKDLRFVIGKVCPGVIFTVGQGYGACVAVMLPLRSEEGINFEERREVEYGIAAVFFQMKAPHEQELRLVASEIFPDHAGIISAL